MSRSRSVVGTMSKQLAHMPLVEALLEVHWALKGPSPGGAADPAHSLFMASFYGRFHERVKRTYPYLEALQTAEVPDAMIPNVVKYRFRAKEKGWPLVQVGPGIAALNYTQGYDWDSFLAAAKNFLPDVIATHSLDSQEEHPEFTNVLLRYINFVEVNLQEFDIIEYIASNLHTRIVLPKKVIESPQKNGHPTGLQLNLSFPLSDPRGAGMLRFASGKHGDKSGVVWELNIRSTKDNGEVPQEVEGFEVWLKKSHEMIETWFFSLIEGEFKKRFEGA